MKSHKLIENFECKNVRIEKKPLINYNGEPIEGLHNTWIIIDNPKQYNSYTTEAVKGIILGFREASVDRSCVAVVFTGEGDKAFCTGGNTKEYAEYYAGNPQEYKQYMRLFNDMVTSILTCDKPVINRVNGMRIAGGQEIGMACDISVAADTARFGQAGPKHGSAPDGGSTDFLHLYVGIGYSMESCTLCEHWSAHRSLRLGLINKIAPVMKNKEGEFIPNPFVTLEETDAYGRPCFGDFLLGEEKNRAKQIASECTIDFSLLDKEVNKMAYSFALTMPDCMSKTINLYVRKNWNTGIGIVRQTAHGWH